MCQLPTDVLLFCAKVLSPRANSVSSILIASSLSSEIGVLVIGAALREGRFST